MHSSSGYEIRCTLSYGDIYGQILVWLLLTFLSLALGMALGASGHPEVGAAMVILVFACSLPFLLFAFVMTLAGRISLIPKPEAGLAPHA